MGGVIDVGEWVHRMNYQAVYTGPILQQGMMKWAHTWPWMGFNLGEGGRGGPAASRQPQCQFTFTHDELIRTTPFGGRIARMGQASY